MKSYSTVLLACWMFSLGLALGAKSSIQLDEDQPVHRLHSAPGRHRRSGSETTPSLTQREYAPTTDNAVVSAAQVSPSVSSDASASPAIESPYTASLPVASSKPISLTLPSTPTCDKSHTKSEINRLLIQCEANLQNSTLPILNHATQVTQQNAQELGSQIVTELQELRSQLKLALSSLQLCGMDAKPLSSDKGIALSDVSWSAFQVVLTLKPVYQSITDLYKPFPVIKTMCSDLLLTISTALASLIGACGEQMNLFDTRFFPLVTPQLEEFSKLDDSFVSFVGTFTS